MSVSQCARSVLENDVNSPPQLYILILTRHGVHLSVIVPIGALGENFHVLRPEEETRESALERCLSGEPHEQIDRFSDKGGNTVMLLV